MNLDEEREKFNLKLDEKKAEYEQKKEEARINHEERKINIKAKYTDKKINFHIEKTINKFTKAEEDAEKEIAKALDAIDKEIKEIKDIPIEFILFKATNKLEEIVLETELKMKKAKNELIKNLEKDMGNVTELVSMEENLEDFKSEIEEYKTLLNEKIEIEKDTLNLKNKE